MLKDLAREKVRALVESYDSIVRMGRKAEYSEADVGSKFILPLLSALGWDVTKIEDVKEQRRTLTGVADYSLFNVGGTAKIFLELKKFEEDLDGSRRVGGKVKSFPQIAIDYAWQSRADWAVLTNFEETRLYYSRVRKPEEGLIFKLKYHEYLENFDKLWLISKDSVVSGLLDTYEKKRLRRNVDEELLKDLVYCRRLLVSNVRKNNPQLSKEEINEATQKILDRLMFIRSCEDRLIIPAESLWTQFSVWQKIAIDKSVRTFMMDLKNIFRDFDAVYNGQLFAPHPCEDLRIDNEVLEAILTLLYNYNFDLIPVNVLGNAYELYIGTIIKEKKGTLKEDELTLVEDPSVRKKHGIYYTPEYIVDYIIRNTLGELLKNCKRVDEVSKIKVLDPACGSGSFLIKAFDVIKEWYDNYNKQNKLAATPNTLYAHFPAISNIEEKILTENLYGVDLDPQAVEITIMNLSLKAIKTKEKLPYLGDHIKCGNSLIDVPEVAGNKAFNWMQEYKEIMDKQGFDVIIGNPPYNAEFNEQEKNYFNAKYRRFSSKDSAEYFLARAAELLKPGGIMGFIVPKSLAFYGKWGGIRNFLFENFAILNVADVGLGFPDVNLEEIIIVAKKEKPIDDYHIKVERFSDLKRRKTMKSIVKSELVKCSIMRNNNMIIFSPLSSREQEILRKIDANSIKFSNILKDSFRGIYISDRDKLKLKKGPVKFIDNEPWIQRYYVKNYVEINTNEEFIDQTKVQKILQEKLIFKVLRGKRLAVHYDSMGEWLTPSNVVNVVIRENKGYDYRFLLGVMNSSLLSFYVQKSIFSDTTESARHIDYLYLSLFPVPKDLDETKQKSVIELVEKMLSLSKQLNKMNVDFDRYFTEPIISYINFKSYCDKLDVKDKEALDKTSNGTVKHVKVEEQDSWLTFKVDYFVRKDKTKEEFADIPVLRCKFEDVYFRKFLLYTFRNYKKYWGSGNLLSIILNTPIPCFDKNPDKNKQIIERIMKEFLKAVEEKECIEKEVEQIDNEIDSKVYELYGLTQEEISIIESYFKQK